MQVKGLLERLADDENVCVAEGYVFEFERRGYLEAGAYVPEVVLEHPHLVKAMHQEFVHAGSDVVLAFTYYAHLEKLQIVNREKDYEAMNRTALKLAREVANNTGTLMAGNICNTGLYNPDDPNMIQKLKDIFKIQVQWAVEEGADFIVGETFSSLGEAMLALNAIKESGLPAVVAISNHIPDVTIDGVEIPEACRQLEEAGAAVVGLNCARGPATILPVMKKIRSICKGPICCLPVLYHTTESQKTMQSLKSPQTGEMAFPFDLPAHQCSRTEIADFTKEAMEIGIQYLGLCCGNAAHYTRVMAEVMGRKPPSSKYSVNMSRHICYGTDDRLHYHNTKTTEIVG